MAASLPLNHSFSHSIPTYTFSHNPYKYKCYYLHNISSLCKQGQIQAAFNLLTQMDLQNLLIRPQIYGDLLQGCAYERDFFTGQQIHSRIIKNGDFYTTNEYVEAKLLIFYAKCDRIEISNNLFVRLRMKNVFSWAAIIGLRCRMGFNEDALMGLCDMITTGTLADNFVVPNALKACAALQWIRFGRGVHGYAVKMDFDDCMFVSSSLVDMYGKCSTLDDARKLFDRMPHKNVVTWNSMIVGYVQNGFHQEAIQTFRDMRLEDVHHTQVTLSAFLSASANIGAIEEGEQGHAIAVIAGFELDNRLGSSILNLYCKVGFIEDAELVFSMMLEKDVVAWNLLISSYVQADQAQKALRLCLMMRLENIKFDSVTLASIFSACAKMKNIQLGKECHSYCIRNNLQSGADVACGILTMYANCDQIGKARKVFDSMINKDLMLWNVILTAYAERGLAGETLRFFYQMQLEGLPPNATSWNAVILGFIRNGQVTRAKEMFSEMQAARIPPNLVTLTTLISGLVSSGLENEALLIFQKMQEFEIRPDTESIICAISACADQLSLQQGRAIHGHIVRHGLWLQIPIANALRDMYVKCGYINQSRMISIKEPLTFGSDDLCLSPMGCVVEL
ncbi:pentatricopeptide repeat-containing protein At5g55740, chloroplastic [Euphorbia lathyris]|uniref:pentatricopeptide repeat-containing protein At5g55740, chloroplastic n=1 Tax=Euphorbia lathyris TaxID=212925 RepID=UPI0033141857